LSPLRIRYVWNNTSCQAVQEEEARPGTLTHRKRTPAQTCCRWNPMKRRFIAQSYRPPHRRQRQRTGPGQKRASEATRCQGRRSRAPRRRGARQPTPAPPRPGRLVRFSPCSLASAFARSRISMLRPRPHATHPRSARRRRPRSQGEEERGRGRAGPRYLNPGRRIRWGSHAWCCCLLKLVGRHMSQTCPPRHAAPPGALRPKRGCERRACHRQFESSSNE
jgi:hypothetical protein